MGRAPAAASWQRVGTLFVLLTGALVPLALVTPAAQPRGPNVLFILADDLGVNDLGAYGRADHRTPRLDRLAAEGVRFTASYAAASICSPSRAALLTGLAPARLHLTTFIPGRADLPAQRLRHPLMRQQLPLEHLTLAERFAQAGYATAAIGKWHLGEAGFGPTQQGFELEHRGTANTPPTADEGSKGEFDLTAAAERFIGEPRDRPFFLYLAHNTPHIPYAARPEDAARSADAFEPAYASVIETFDRAVGRLLDRVQALGLADRTIVIVTSDNGGLHVPEGPHRRVTHNTPFRAGKGFLYEGGVRVPLIVRWPGRVKAGRVVDTPVLNTDWVPTLIDLLDLTPATGLDGVSRADALLDRPPSRTVPLFWHQPHYTNQGGRPSGAVRDGDWKLVEDYDSGKVELFDLRTDPGEAGDRAAGEPDRAEALRRSLHDWRRRVGAQENTRNSAVDEDAYRRLYLTFDASRFDPRRASAEEWSRVLAWRDAMNDAVRPGPETSGKMRDR